MLRKFLAAPAVLAAAALVAMPAAATELSAAPRLPVEATQGYGPVVSVGWGGGWGWGRGYRGHRHRHRGSTAGDILAGVLILGTIAAVANAANKANQRSRYPERYPYPDRRQDYRPSGPQGLESAADLCLREVERDARAEEVTGVERNAGGWRVNGRMADGASFTCSIGADGRIETVDIGGRAAVLTAPRGDESDADTAWRASEARATDEAQPAYPGGPLPGEEADPETLRR